MHDRTHVFNNAPHSANTFQTSRSTWVYVYNILLLRMCFSCSDCIRRFAVLIIFRRSFAMTTKILLPSKLTHTEYFRNDATCSWALSKLLPWMRLVNILCTVFYLFRCRINSLNCRTSKQSWIWHSFFPLSFTICLR